MGILDPNIYILSKNLCLEPILARMSLVSSSIATFVGSERELRWDIINQYAGYMPDSVYCMCCLIGIDAILLRTRIETEAIHPPLDWDILADLEGELRPNYDHVESRSATRARRNYKANSKHSVPFSCLVTYEYQVICHRSYITTQPSNSIIVFVINESVKPRHSASHNNGTPNSPFVS